MNGFWIMLGLCVLGLSLDNGLSNIAKSLLLRERANDSR